MEASIGKIASPAPGAGHFEKDGYDAMDDGAHREASAWAGKGGEAPGLSGPGDPEAFRRVLEGEVPRIGSGAGRGGRRLPHRSDGRRLRRSAVSPARFRRQGCSRPPDRAVARRGLPRYNQRPWRTL